MVLSILICRRPIMTAHPPPLDTPPLLPTLPSGVKMKDEWWIMVLLPRSPSVKKNARNSHTVAVSASSLPAPHTPHKPATIVVKGRRRNWNPPDRLLLSSPPPLVAKRCRHERVVVYWKLSVQKHFLNLKIESGGHPLRM